MTRYWLSIVMLPLAFLGPVPGPVAADTPEQDGPRMLAKATGCVQVTSCASTTFAGPIGFDRKRDDVTSFAEYHVLRNAEELAIRMGGVRLAQDATVQKQAEEQLAKFLNVKEIDWGKQMVVALLAKYQDGEGDFEVEFTAPRSENGVLHVGWRQIAAKNVDKVVDKRFARLAYGVALLDRFDGNLRFAAERQIIAKALTLANQANIGPIHFNGTDQQLVIRSAEELAACSRDPSQSKDKTVQKQVEADLVQLLKVKAIDWNKHTIIAIDGQKQLTLMPVEFVSVQSERFWCTRCPGRAGQERLTVAWRLETGGRFQKCWPRGVALVDRFDGAVEFKIAESK